MVHCIATGAATITGSWHACSSTVNCYTGHSFISAIHPCHHLICTLCDHMHVALQVPLTLAPRPRTSGIQRTKARPSSNMQVGPMLVLVC
jgi:hypothetical protein